MPPPALLIEKVELLQNILISRAQYKHQEGDDEEYRKIRGELISLQDVAADLPRFVKTCRSLSEFWDFIKANNLPTYQSRRIFIREQFKPLLTKLESGDVPPSPIGGEPTRPDRMTKANTDKTAPRLSGPTHRDVFICHASEDKVAVARPLAELLKKRGLTVWIDEEELTIGDSLRANAGAPRKSGSGKRPTALWADHAPLGPECVEIVAGWTYGVWRPPPFHAKLFPSPHVLA